MENIQKMKNSGEVPFYRFLAKKMSNFTVLIESPLYYSCMYAHVELWLLPFIGK